MGNYAWISIFFGTKTMYFFFYFYMNILRYSHVLCKCFLLVCAFLVFLMTCVWDSKFWWHGISTFYGWDLLSSLSCLTTFSELTVALPLASVWKHILLGCCGWTVSPQKWDPDTLAPGPTGGGGGCKAKTIRPWALGGWINTFAKYSVLDIGLARL